jgi:hypothetical protein
MSVTIIIFIPSVRKLIKHNHDIYVDYNQYHPVFTFS